MSRPMEGIRILEVAEQTFVPAASAILSDWGAEVIKIEHVERGDAIRGLAGTGMVMFDTDVLVLAEHANRGKKSLALDLTSEEGRDLLYRLAATSDVFLTNKLAAVRKKLLIDVDDIRAHNPDIVYVRGSGYGARGPEVDAGGYDILGFWYRAGTAVAATPEDTELLAMMPGPAYGDTIGAMTIAGGISTALLHRERSGHAAVVDVSLLGAGMWAMGAGIAQSLHTGESWRMPVRESNVAPHNPLAGSYETADGKRIAFSMLQGAYYWPEACERLGIDEYAADERFTVHEHLMEHARAGEALIAARMKEETFAYWCERFTGMRGQWAPVQDTLDLASDPMVTANGYLQELRTKDGHAFQLVTTPVQFDEEPQPSARAPEFNEHGDDILTGELGLDWDTVIDLKVRGIVA
jgi:crotonobetainyl-CoA:carnitine CoA-transferase CaiB-like acyl-CoA transferase